MVKVALGRHSSGLLAEWSPSDEMRLWLLLPCRITPMSGLVVGFVLDRIAGVSSSGAVFFFCSLF